MTIRTLFALLLAIAWLPVAAEPVTYRVDPDHTSVHFEAKHFATSSLRGRFDRKEGAVVLDRAAKTGRAEVTFEIDSLNTPVVGFTNAVKGKNFLNAAEFPTAKFVGDQFTFEGDKLTAVGGNLTLVGKTNPIKMTAITFNCYESSMLKREVCGGDFEATIQRSQWGMVANAGSVGDSIKLLIQIEAIRQ